MKETASLYGMQCSHYIVLMEITGSSQRHVLLAFSTQVAIAWQVLIRGLADLFNDPVIFTGSGILRAVHHIRHLHDVIWHIQGDTLAALMSGSVPAMARCPLRYMYRL